MQVIKWDNYGVITRKPTIEALQEQLNDYIDKNTRVNDSRGGGNASRREWKIEILKGLINKAT